MSTETEIAEVKEEKKASPESTPKENEYKIFDYFNGNTSMLIACVSALVAVMSFFLHFAVGRMNYAYLAYWDISSLHANTSNQNEIYMVAGVFAFTLVLMIIRSVLSKISDTFRFFIPLLALTNRGVKLSKREKKNFLKELHKVSKKFARLPLKKRESVEGKEIKKEIEKYRKQTNKELQDIRSVKKARQALRLLVTLQIAFVCFLLFLLGSIFVLIINTTGTMRDSIRISWIVALFIGIELLGKYVPAYFESRHSCKQYTDEEVFGKVKEMLRSEIPEFPFGHLKTWEIKTMFTDKVIKSMMKSILVGVISLILSMPFVGTFSAKMVRTFPMYTDGEVSYAVVYTSGSTRYMEKATIEDGTLIIDTTKQRILTSDDISYTVEVFDNVSVIKIDEALKIEKDIIPVERILTQIDSFVETVWTKIGEVLTEDAECVPGT